LPKVKHPLLVIWGENDPWTPIAGAAIYQQERETGPDVEFVAIPNAGHCPHDEKPDAVNPLILTWLGEHLKGDTPVSRGLQDSKPASVEL
jgi:pimeloyl-ACP methyl ester carboxylesterase